MAITGGPEHPIDPHNVRDTHEQWQRRAERLERQFLSSPQGVGDRAAQAEVEDGIASLLGGTNGSVTQQRLDCRGNTCLGRLLASDTKSVRSLMNALIKNRFFRTCSFGFEGEPEDEATARASETRRVVLLLTCR